MLESLSSNQSINQRDSCNSVKLRAKRYLCHLQEMIKTFIRHIDTCFKPQLQASITVMFYISSLNVTLRHPVSPKNCPFPWGTGSRPPSNTSFLGPTRPTIPNCISIESAVFAKYTFVTNGLRDRLTDRRTDRTNGELGLQYQ